MTTTTRPGFTALAARVFAPCYGANHRDGGLIGTCDGCGWPVAKTKSGRILDITHSPRGGRRIACWSHGHECNPEAAAAHAAARAAEIESGAIIKGARVVVVKGRKVPLGTTGTVTWVGEDSWGKPRIGFRTADGESFFTATSNVQPATD
jgi:hypothetical protein